MISKKDLENVENIATAQNVYWAFKIIFYLRNQTERKTSTDMSKFLGIDKSRVKRILNALSLIDEIKIDSKCGCNGGYLLQDIKLEG